MCAQHMTPHGFQDTQWALGALEGSSGLPLIRSLGWQQEASAETRRTSFSIRLRSARLTSTGPWERATSLPRARWTIITFYYAPYCQVFQNPHRLFLGFQLIPKEKLKNQ